jgi:hypothetical protein
MTRPIQGFCIFFGSIIVTIAVLAGALAWGPHHCKLAFPMVIGCALGSYESLAAGMIASSAALIAGWLAWSGVQTQIEAEEKRASADRVEVETVLREDVNRLAKALASIWIILDGFNKEGAEREENKIEAVSYGIKAITRDSWISTSRRMVTVLGWARRRHYEELFDGLEGLRRFQNVGDVREALDAVRSVSRDFEVVQPETEEYFKGLFRRPIKGWSLGETIALIADPRLTDDLDPLERLRRWASSPTSDRRQSRGGVG